LSAPLSGIATPAGCLFEFAFKIRPTHWSILPTYWSLLPVPVRWGEGGGVGVRRLNSLHIVCPPTAFLLLLVLALAGAFEHAEARLLRVRDRERSGRVKSGKEFAD